VGTRLIGLAVIASIFASSAAAAQASPERVSFDTASDCSSPDSIEILREAISVRLGQGVQLVSEAASYGVSWSPGSAGCRLLVRTPSTATPVSLASDADPDAIRNAASRAAWLLANAEPQEPTPAEATEQVPDAPTGETPLADTSEETSSEETGGTSSDDVSSEAEPVAAVEVPEPPAPEDGEQGEQTDSDDAVEESGDSEGADDAPSEEPLDDRPADEEENANAQDGGDDQKDQPDADEVSEPEPEPEPEPRYTEVDVRVSVLPGMAVPLGNGPYVSRVAFNIIGWQAGVREVEFGLLANVDTDFVEGSQFAGLANISLGETDGLSVAGSVNVTAGRHAGQQVSTAFNYAGSLEGGVQASMVNLTNGFMNGTQLGGVNASGDASGVQVGLVNIGRRVEGVQLGLLNIASDSDYSLGLLNVNYERPLYVDLWATELGANHVGIRHGSRYIQGILATGFRPSTSPSRAMWSVGFGLGVNVPLDDEERFFIEADAIDYILVAPDPGTTNAAAGNQLQLRLNAGWRLAKRFALFGGGSLNVLFSDTAQTDAVTFSGPLVLESTADAPFTALWPGFQAGVRF
jgi:hypothetical protein